MLPNYLLLLIELPQTKLGPNASRLRVTGQLGEVYENTHLGGTPATQSSRQAQRIHVHAQRMLPRGSRSQKMGRDEHT